MSYVAGEDAAEKTAFEEQVKQLEKLKEDRLKKLKNGEGKTRNAARHELRKNDLTWQATYTSILSVQAFSVFLLLTEF